MPLFGSGKKWTLSKGHSQIWHDEKTPWKAKKKSSTHTALLLDIVAFRNIAIQLTKKNPGFHQFLFKKRVWAAHRSRVIGWTNPWYGKWLGNQPSPWTYVQLRICLKLRDMFQSSPLLLQASQWVSHETDFDLRRPNSPSQCHQGLRPFLDGYY